MDQDAAGQDPKVGGYPMADEANKWGLWRDEFAKARAEARQFQDMATKASWCSPYYRTLIEEFYYVWRQDKVFLAFYAPYGDEENPYSGKEPNVAEMGLILARLKDCISRSRQLWGYPKVPQGSLPRTAKLLLNRNGGDKSSH